MRVDFFCVSLILGLLCIARSASPATPVDPFLGISPQDEKYYRSSDTIACKDGSKKFTRAQLNDDFCDCPDATDEPGTSACPGGKFYCKNVGHAPLLIFSSRVNDGLCDCCDGSDEYDGSVKCSNTCWEAGKVARDKLKNKIATYQEGVDIRRHEIEQAKITMANDEAELSRLKSEEKILKGIVEQLKDRKEQIEKAEEKERLRKEKEEKEKKEAEEKVNHKEVDQGKREAEEKADITKDNPVESAIDDEIGNIEDSLPDQHAAPTEEMIVLTEESKEDSAVEPEESNEDYAVQSKADADTGSKKPLDEVKEVENGESKSTEGLSSEELGRLVASRWTGENSGKQGEESDVVKDNHLPEDDDQIPEDAPHEEYDHYVSDTDDDNSKYDSYDGGDVDDDIEDETHEDHSGDHEYSSSYTADSYDESDFKETTTPTWWEKIRQTARSILKAVNPFQTPVDISEAETVRKEYEESRSKLSKMKSRISSLTEKLKLDFGPEKEYFSFYDRCFEGKQSKYVYKVCPYKQATQMEGHSTTRLGNWDKFEQTHKVMLFSNGDKCWNGPDRSLKVKLRCGLKNEITDVDEPSRCEYVALLATPALCSEEKLKELQEKLELMNKDQPRGHDEL